MLSPSFHLAIHFQGIIFFFNMENVVKEANHIVHSLRKLHGFRWSVEHVSFPSTGYTFLFCPFILPWFIKDKRKFKGRHIDDEQTPQTHVCSPSCANNYSLTCSSFLSRQYSGKKEQRIRVALLTRGCFPVSDQSHDFFLFFTYIFWN
jgi:hypothetical protein